MLADEYYEAQLLDPRRARELQRDILQLVRDTHIDRELQLDEQLDSDADAAIWLPRLDTYLCDLKESQIRDGLHVFGESPTGRLCIDTLLALLRIPRAMGVVRNQACSGRWRKPLNWASIRSIVHWPSRGTGRVACVVVDQR